jgi:hypothetical protein
VLKLSRDVGDELVELIDRRLETVPEEIRKGILSRLLDQMAGRMAHS